MYGDFFNRAIAVIHSFRDYMEQIIFDSTYLLRPATIFEYLYCAFGFLTTANLFNYSNCSHPSLEIIVHLFLCFMAVIHSLKRSVSFSFVVLLAVIHCRSISFVFTPCNSLLIVFIRFIVLNIFN